MSKNPADCRSVDQLIAAIDESAPPKFVLFWGHTPRAPGAIDASCLSNWFPAAFEIDGVRYATTEHYMMAEKARLFGDEEVRSEIIAADSPGKAKALGRKVRDFDDEVWTEHRLEIVVAGNLAKFSQDDRLGEFLRTTGNKVLVEASPPDRIWGIGLSRDNEKATQPKRWRGLNLLGFALMEVRSRL